MRSVLFVNTSSLPIPATSGGAIQQVLSNIISVIDKRQVSVTVLTPSTDASKEERQSVKYTDIKWIDIKDNVQSGGLFGILRSCSVLNKTLKGVQAKEFSHVVIFDPYLATVVRRWNKRAKIIWSAHNGRSRTKILLKYWVNSVDHIISISEFLKRNIDTDIGNKRNRYSHSVIYNPLQPEWINKEVHGEKNSYSLLFCGRIVPEKGLDVLIRSIQQFPDALRLKIKLGIAGGSHFKNSNETDYIKHIRRMLEESDFQFEMYGFVSHSELIEIYDNYDILVVPSNWDEPATLVTAEGQLRHCRIVASNAGGLPEMVAPEWKQYIVPPGDPIALRASIEALLILQDDEINEKRIKGRKWVIEQFGDSRLMNDWNSVLS